MAKEISKNGVIEYSERLSTDVHFTGTREFYEGPNMLKYQFNYVNGRLHGKSTVYNFSRALLKYEHYYDSGKLIYSIQYNYIGEDLISKFKIMNNTIEII